MTCIAFREKVHSHLFMCGYFNMYFYHFLSILKIFYSAALCIFSAINGNVNTQF